MPKKDKGLILALFSKSPYALAPWAKAGYLCKNIDWEADCGYRDNQFYESFDLRNIKDLIAYIDEGGVNPSLILSFPPCDDLAVSGARHFASKRKKDPAFQQKAMELFMVGMRLAEHYQCPSLTENPMSVASTLYRKSDYKISPHEFGGYVPPPGVHPEWPQYIAPRDRYRKTTHYWATNGFTLPPKKPLPLAKTGVTSDLGKAGNSKQFLKLGGKSKKTKTIRSMTPRGVFMGIFQHMKETIQ